MANASQWAVVTGASSGIGKATALTLAADGWNVVLHCRASVDATNAVAEEIHKLGRQTHVFAYDLSDPAGCSSLVESVWKTIGAPAVWIHNAGADTLTGSNAKLNYVQKLDLLYRVDLMGTMLTCKEVGARMKTASGGSIVTIGWDQVDTGMEGDSGELFAAIKAGVMAFTRSLAKSIAPEVRVNCVAPGWIRTAWGEKASEYWQERVRRETPLERWGTPQDVANTIAFLVSERGSFLTGQTIRVNGGVTMG